MTFVLPTGEPLKVVSGDTWAWLQAYDMFPPSEGWALSYVLQGPQPITINATVVGSNFQVKVTAAATAAYPAGLYTWTAFVTNSGTGERYSVGQAQLQVLPNTATLTGVQDLRSDNQKAYDAITAVIAGKATHDVLEYEIQGRKVRKMNMRELLQAQAYFKSRVRAEQGLGAGKRIGVSFGPL